MHLRPARPAALAVVALLALSGCSALFGADEPIRDEETGEITEASDASAMAIEVGDCLDAADLGSVVETVLTKPCSEAHDAEVYAAKDLPEGDYPEDAETLADDFCYEEFEAFVGLAYEESELDYFKLFPQTEGWAMGDREISCLVVLEEGGLTESLKGSAR